MKKINVAILTLGLFLFQNSANASVLSPFKVSADEMASQIVAKHGVGQAQAAVLASTIVKGMNALAGDAMKSESAFKAFLDKPENADLKRALSVLSDSDTSLDNLSARQLGDLNNAIGTRVGARAADACRECGIDTVLKERFGVRVFIPVSSTISAKDLQGAALNPGTLASSIASIRTVKTSKTALIKEMSSKDVDSVSLMSMRKIQLAAECSVSGKCGEEAAEFANQMLIASDGQVVGSGRAIAITRDLMDEGAEGAQTMKTLSDDLKQINADAKYKSVDERLTALCKKMADRAKASGKQASFNNLKNCPNYRPIFDKCSI